MTHTLIVKVTTNTTDLRTGTILNHVIEALEKDAIFYRRGPGHPVESVHVSTPDGTQAVEF